MTKHRKDREIPAITTKPVKGLPLAPKMYDSRTKELHKIICEDLEARGRLEVPTIHLVNFYCDSYMIYKMAMDEISELNKLTTKDRKTERKNPIYHVRRQAMDEMLNLEKKLGLSPYSRDRITIAQNEDAPDPMDSL